MRLYSVYYISVGSSTYIYIYIDNYNCSYNYFITEFVM